MKETIIQNLKKYNYNYQLEGKNRIRVKLDLQLHVLIDVTDVKVNFSNELVPWNPLTGIFKTSLTRYMKAIVFWSFAIVMLYFAMASVFFDVNVFLFNMAILITSFGYLSIVSVYYFITYESFKTKVMLWLK